MVEYLSQAKHRALVAMAGPTATSLRGASLQLGAYAKMSCKASGKGLSSAFWGEGETCFLNGGSRIQATFGLVGSQRDGERRTWRPFRVEARKKSGFAEIFANKLAQKQGEEVASTKRVRAPLKQGKLSPRLTVPPHIPRPVYADTGVAPPWNETPQFQDAEGIERMRAAGKLAAQVRDYAGTLVKPGVTTDSIDKAVHKMITEAGAYPSPLNYGKFPKSVCTSVNECICHGIPDSRPLVDGDIVNIDVTVFLNGHHGDTSKTFFCGDVDEEAKKLVEVTREALDKAISICRPGQEFKKIGRVINEIADKHKYGVVRHFVGHGVGKVFHSGPAVLHYRNNEPGVMSVGQTFTIEPMFTIGSIKDELWNDNWTVVTADGSLSAQFEHSLLITETGVEVLTQ